MLRWSGRNQAHQEELLGRITRKGRWDLRYRVRREPVPATSWLRFAGEAAVILAVLGSIIYVSAVLAFTVPAS